MYLNTACSLVDLCKTAHLSHGMAALREPRGPAAIAEQDEASARAQSFSSGPPFPPVAGFFFLPCFAALIATTGVVIVNG
jgi:hypothetical protein